MNFRKRVELESMGFQIAPMVDVLILLLIFFVTSWKFSRFETEIEISVPAAEKGAPLDRQFNEIIINVRKDGTVVVDSRPTSDEDLLARFGRITSINPNVAVIVRGDKDTRYEDIVHILDVCKKAGVWNVSFMTARPTS
jgi:biopolymer transport protein ExbD